jgi:nicotinate phosphoribosyltransferase
VRAILDEAEMGATQIIASGDLDEYKLDRLTRAGAPIDAFGVGTRLVTSSDAPSLGGIYKLTESAGRPVAKSADAKATLPGRHQVFRDDDGDTIALADERLPGRPLLRPVMRDGELLGALPALDDVRALAAAEIRALPERLLAIDGPDTLRPRLSPRLAQLKEMVSG